MHIIETDIEGVLIIDPETHCDNRGYLAEVYSSKTWKDNDLPCYTWVQENVSVTNKGVLRGMHMTLGVCEAKLLGCLHGQVFDVTVDCRPNSPTFGNTASCWLSGSFRRILVPPGVAHGFYAMDLSVVSYLLSWHYDPDNQVVLAWDDDKLDIMWPFLKPGFVPPVLSEKDAKGLTFDELQHLLYGD